MENSEQVVATFEYNGSVYNIQILNKNGIASVTPPTSTANATFNGWTVNGESVDLATYHITTNTKFVADVSYQYTVNFVVDNRTVKTQTVAKDGIPQAPANPTKSGYEFDGWSIDNINVINVDSYQITSDTTYTAIFTRLYTVTFKYENSTVNTQTVRNGGYATTPTVTNTDYKIVNGWKVNNGLVDVANYRITGNTTFTADITYRYNVNFKVGYDIYQTQIVTKNDCATLPTPPTKNDNRFNGWSLDGKTVIDVTSYRITGTTNFTAVFTPTTYFMEVEFGEDDMPYLSTFNIWNDGTTAYCTNYQNKFNYRFNKETLTWEHYSWYYKPFSNQPAEELYSNATDFWYDGTDVYRTSGYTLKLNESKDYWNYDNNSTPNGRIERINGVNYIFGYDGTYSIFHSDTKTWETKTMTGFVGNYLSGNNSKVVGKYLIYKYQDNFYVFNTRTGNWDLTDWTYKTDYDHYSFTPEYMWTDGEKIYCTGAFCNYVLNETTFEWEEYDNHFGIGTVYGNDIWTDGIDVYYNHSGHNYILVKE